MLSVLILALCINVIASDYTIPQPKFTFVTSSGFQVSIPDEDGIQLFAFHANINKKMELHEAGQISEDVVNKKGGKWVYQICEEKKKLLSNGDSIYYWIFVIKNSRGYMLDDGVFKVNGIKKFSKKTCPYKRNKRHSFYPGIDDFEDHTKPYNFKYFNNHGPQHHHRDHFSQYSHESRPWTHNHNHNHNHQMRHDWPTDWHHKHNHHKCNHHFYDNDENSSESSEETYPTQNVFKTTTDNIVVKQPVVITSPTTEVTKLVTIIEEVNETSAFPLIDIRFRNEPETER